MLSLRLGLGEGVVLGQGSPSGDTGVGQRAAPSFTLMLSRAASTARVKGVEVGTNSGTCSWHGSTGMDWEGLTDLARDHRLQPLAAAAGHGQNSANPSNDH